MIEKLFGHLRFGFDLFQEVKRLRSDMRAVQEAEQERTRRDYALATALAQILSKLDNLEDTERLEREKLLLQLENELLKFERRLPPKSD